MIWKNIRDEQPEDGEWIVQLDLPYDGHFPMGMRIYHKYCSWEEELEFCKKNKLRPPEFWWILARDFPFPDLKRSHDLEI